MPERIQLSRAKGWKMPANTVNCARPGKWGNQYVVWLDQSDRQWYVTRGSCYTPVADKAAGCRLAVEMHAADLRAYLAKQMYPPDFILRDLRGKNLACWCAVGDPCHVDIYLELANVEAKEPTR